MNRREMFNKMAAEWEATFQDAEKESVMRDALSRIGLATAHRILDLGCGAGKLIPLIREQTHPDSLIVALDYAEEMVKVARKTYPEKYVSAIVGDAYALPFKDNSFDRIILLAMLPHLPDKARVLATLHRILVPGGLVLIVHLAGRETIHRIHREHGGPLAHDTIPSGPELSRLFLKARLQPTKIIDSSDLYLAIARKDLDIAYQPQSQ